MTRSVTSAPANRSRAFTLVELLVVVAIIALLIGILLPAMERAKEITRRVTCMSSLRQIGTACVEYAADNEDWSPDWPGRPLTDDYYWYEPGGPGDGQRNLQHRQTADGGGPVCVGKLMTGGYLPEKSGVVYCPSRNQKGRYGSEATAYGWSNWNKPPYSAVEYAYQHRMSRKLSNGDAGDVFGSDLAIWDNYYPYPPSVPCGAPLAHKDGYYNVSYFDQSVQPFYDAAGVLEDPGLGYFWFNRPDRALNMFEDPTFLD